MYTSMLDLAYTEKGQLCHLFVSVVLTNLFIFLEPGLFFLQAGVIRFLYPCFFKEQSCKSVLFYPLTNMFFIPSIFLMVFFFLSLLQQKFLVLLDLFSHPFFQHARIIAVLAFSKTSLFFHALHITNCFIIHAIS